MCVCVCVRVCVCVYLTHFCRETNAKSKKDGRNLPCFWGCRDHPTGIFNTCHAAHVVVFLDEKMNRKNEESFDKIS